MFKKTIGIVALGLMVGACGAKETKRELVEQGIESFEVTYVKRPKHYIGEFTPVDNHMNVLKFSISQKRCSNWKAFPKGSVHNIPYSLYVIYYEDNSHRVHINYDLSHLKVCGKASYSKYM